jgi:hypothetical protein
VDSGRISAGYCDDIPTLITWHDGLHLTAKDPEDCRQKAQVLVLYKAIESDIRLSNNLSLFCEEIL